MKLPDGFSIQERYVDKVIAQGDLDYYEEVMREMFCPLSGKACRSDCMFFNDGAVVALGDGTFDLTLPFCSVFLGGSR